MKVQRRLCETCIYRPDSALDLQRLEAQVRERGRGTLEYYKAYRACHHAQGGDVCCRGFWEAHKDQFTLGQIAQRLNAVEFVEVDDL